MKRIISMLLVCFMLLPAVCVSAASTPSLDFLKNSASIRSVEETGTVSFKLNEPFGLLELLAKEEFAQEVSNYVDIVALFESLFDSTIQVSAKTELSDDGMKGLTEAHIKSNIVLKANDNLEGDVKTNYSVWMDYDFSNEEKPYFDMIMAQPFAAKYITFNSDLLSQEGVDIAALIAELYKTALDKDNIAKLNDDAIESVKKNATVTGNSRRVKIVFDDIGLKMYIADVMISALNQADASLLESIDLDEIKQALATVPVFGNEAMVMECTLDTKGRIEKEKAILNVDFNIYDLMTALGEQPDEESGLTRENCKLNFTAEAQSEYNYNFVKVEKPVLTEENSIDILKYGDPNYYDEPEDNYVEPETYYSPWVYADIDNNCFAGNDAKYVKLRSFFEGIGYSVSYDNGTIKVETDSADAKHKTLSFVVNSDTVNAENNNVKMVAPVFEKDGASYISVADCEKLTYLKKESLYYHYESEYGYLEFYDYSYFNEEW
ncbi:MAG: hypothetical protein IJF30_05370 [Clostridia bacterium]|nr:hypothetical protein [Clostridia bacterium]